MAVQVQCPRCQHPLSVAEEGAGGAVTCPQCKGKFRLSASVEKRAAASGSGTAPRPSSNPDKKGIPASIGGYLVRGKLGEGAFGVVYRCYDKDLEREVAIKVIKADKLSHADPTKSENVTRRFLREAKVMAKFRHANIVPVYGTGEHEGAPYIASAFIPGRTLAELIPEGGMEPRRAVQLAIQLLDALTYAHEKGVLHRDIKPANAMVEEKDTLALMDFGLAGWVDEEEQRLTQAGTVMGTPSYMPPEQARGEISALGPASDQYSAGVVLYEMLTGHLPFEAPNIPALLYQIDKLPPAPLRQWCSNLDAGLEAICLQSLAKDPGQRHPSCREFAERLRAWLQSANPVFDVPLEVPPPTPGTMMGELLPPAARSTVNSAQRRSSTKVMEPPPPPVPPPPPRPAPRRSRPWGLISVGLVALVVLVLAGAAGVWYLKNGSGTTPTEKTTQSRPTGGLFDNLNK